MAHDDGNGSHSNVGKRGRVYGEKVMMMVMVVVVVLIVIVID